MSTKNLARTAIEGGRTGASKYQRRMSHRYHRAAVRGYLHKLLLDKDRDVYHRKPVPTIREAVGTYGYEISFADNLNPVQRWLDKKVGRPWNEVKAAIHKRFDSRTTAGRHILYDHILTDVVNHTDVRSYMDYVIDPDGILRMSEYRLRRKGS